MIRAGQIGEEIGEGVEPYEDAPFEVPQPAPDRPARVPVPA